MRLRILILFACAAFASAAPRIVRGQQDGHAGTVDSPYLVLIRDPVIQELLSLDDKQRAAVQQLTDKLDAPMWKSRSLAAEQHAVETARLIAEAQKGMSEILTAAQHKQLAQAELRAIGRRSLLRADVGEALKLSDDQLKKITATLDETKKLRAELEGKYKVGGKTEDNDTFQAKLAELSLAEQERVAAILDEHQQRRFRELVGDEYDTSRLGNIKFKAPEFDGTDGWINTRPIQLDDLRGKVVALHFWTFGCINCIHNFPSYKAWYDDYTKSGLVIVGVHAPEGAHERDVAAVKAKTREADFAFPVLIDNSKHNWTAWGNTMWPTVYLIDKQGYVRTWWSGELNWQGAEGEKIMRARIETLLAE
jgi:peroxiredoxin